MVIVVDVNSGGPQEVFMREQMSKMWNERH